jgi:hypothetical protein
VIAELPWSAGRAPLRADARLRHLALAAAGTPIRRVEIFESLARDLPIYRDARVTQLLVTREQLFHEMFLHPLKEWTTSRASGCASRRTAAMATISTATSSPHPEAEPVRRRQLDFLAGLAGGPPAHGRGRLESFTAALDFDTLDIEDYHLLAGNAFAAGINRTICHGYAYHYPLQP